MPGPGRGKTKPKSKPKSSGSSANFSATRDTFVGDIDNAQGWDGVVRFLCEYFDLPDLNTRSGLKKVHANFEDIYRRLDTAYQRYSGNDKLMGGIVGIYAKMCADSILRNKLFDKGFLSRLFPLLDIPSCRQLALRALSSVTHHGGVSIRVEIAKQSPVLIRLLQQLPDEPKVAELAIVTLTHAVVAVVAGDKPPEAKVLRSQDMPTILRVVVENLRKPTASSYLINHAVQLLALSTLYCAESCKKYPPVLMFLVAGLRSKDWVFRGICLGGLVRLHRNEAEPDQRTLDPQKFISRVSRRFPDHIVDILMDYGFDRCDTVLTLKSAAENQKVMMKCAQDHNLYALGLSLARLILGTEFSIAEGMFQTDNPVTGRRETMDIGLPFTMWSDALPHCAKAIRAKGTPAEMDLADILDIKYMIMKQRIPAAVELAKKSLERSPDFAYFYYAITLQANTADGLRAAKKGMKCKQTTPFVRFQMMQRAVEHAGDMGICILQGSPDTGDKKWEEGVAFLMSALEDAKTYVEQAPPDNRHMKNVLYWYILLTITIRGSEMSGNLKELEEAISKLKIADDISSFIGVPPPKTNMRLAQQTVVKLYPQATQEWGDIIKKFDEGSPEPGVPITPEKVEDDLAAWLDDVHLDDPQEPEPRCAHPKVNTNRVTLYRCSWCGNPSAILRKCSGCEKTRYCDAACQKAHWRDHKKQCNSTPA